MREDRAVLPHFLPFLRNAESFSANLRAFVEMPLRRVKPLYVQDSMLLYSRKCFLNPRSRLIRFSKNSSFHYFTVDEMGLRLMKLALDEMALYRFQRYLQQNGICKASMLPLYLFSLELLSEAYALKKRKQMRAELDRGALFSCQADVVKRICNTGPNLITIPDKWLLDLDTERDDSSDELLLSPNATFLSQQSGM